jgi:hypothetical protein
MATNFEKFALLIGTRKSALFQDILNCMPLGDSVNDSKLDTWRGEWERIADLTEILDALRAAPY